MDGPYEWDENKREYNIRKHELDFADVHRFGWETAITQQSDRGGETRWIAYGYFESGLHAVVYTMRGDVKRIISFRPAGPKEVQRYD